MVEVTRRARAIAREAGTLVGVAPRLPGAIAGSLARLFATLNIWFWTIVGIPTLCAGVYYFAIASDLYVSEAQFVVHGPNRAPIAGLMSMFSGAGEAVSDNTQIVRAYILSRAAVTTLAHKDQLEAVLSRPEGDFLTRFPGVTYWRKDFEALYRVYANFTSVEIDNNNGIATLEVKAYRPEDAQRIASALLRDSEALINGMNERARNDALASFQREVEQSQAHLAAIEDELTAYRIKANMLEPTAEAKGPYTLLERLNSEEAVAKGQLADAQKNAPRSPQIALLRTRLATLDKLISDERAKITGGDGSIATAMTNYQRLNMQAELEQKILAQAVAAREQARLNAQRQQLYLETIAQPILPDYPLYPRRVVSFATVVGTCLLGYGIAWLLVAGVREHASA